MNRHSLDPRDFAIGILTVTAVILLMGVIVISALPETTLAGEVCSYGGDFSVTVGRVTRDTELIYLVDNSTERMVVYGLDRRSGLANFTDKIDLTRLTPPAAQQGGGYP